MFWSSFVDKGILKDTSVCTLRGLTNSVQTRTSGEGVKNFTLWMASKTIYNLGKVEKFVLFST